MIVVCFSNSISKLCRFSGINLTVAERNPHSFFGDFFQPVQITLPI